jgi:hypothetical protein
MRKSIHILNPVNDCRFTNPNRAKRFIRDRRAVWVNFGRSIRFVESNGDHRVNERKAVDKTRAGYDLAAYDGMAKMHQMSNVPIVGAGKMLNLGKRKGASRHVFLAARVW